MASKKATTSFAPEVEEISIELFEQDEDSVDSPRNGGLQRSVTDAHLSEHHPQHRVRFHTLAGGMEKQLSHEGVQLLSAKAHQIGISNWSGVWQNTVLRRRRKGLKPLSEEEEVQEITNAMEEDQKLMADDVDGEVLRRDALRELTKSLKIKKEIKQRLTASRTTLRRASHRNISYYKSFKYSLSMKWYQIKERIQMALHDNSLWQKDLKVIEGIYGTSVGSYFHFLRYLFLLNSFAAIIIIGFLLVPQIMLNKRSAQPEESSYNADSNLTSFYPPSTSSPADLSSNETVRFGPLDWLTGTGWFDGTLLYYGGYSSDTLTSFDSTLNYHMSQAYFFTICSCFTIYLVFLLYRIFTMYRVNYIESEGESNVTFVEKVFSSWDFLITDEQSASIKHRSIYNELIEMLQEFHEDEVVLAWWQRLCKKLLQSLVWFVFASFLTLLTWSLYLLLKVQLHNFEFSEDGYWKSSFQMLLYPMVVTLLMVVIPVVLESVGRWEKYARQRHELYASVVRVSMLELGILVALVVFWFENSPGLKDELTGLQSTLMSPLSGSPEGECSEEDVSVEGSSSNSTTVQCWESGLGQEIYRLVLIDFLVILISNLVVDRLKPLLVRSGKANKSILEFCIPRNTLHIIYNQTLLWAGVFFCPLLPFIISLKFSLIFYLQKFSVTRNLHPMERPYRAAQTETLFYALTLLSLILSLLSFGFILIRGYSSPSCGPFQGYTHYIDIIWMAVGESEQILLKILAYFLRPGSIFLSIMIISLCVYCIRNISLGRSELVCILRKQLLLETKDRVFLQRLTERVQKGEHHHYRHLSPAKSGPASPTYSGLREDESRHLTRRSSFVFTRSSRSSDDVDGDTAL